MATRLIIDGNAVYEIDEDCLECRGGRKRRTVVRGQEAGEQQRREGQTEKDAGNRRRNYPDQ